MGVVKGAHIAPASPLFCTYTFCRGALLSLIKGGYIGYIGFGGLYRRIP